MKKWIGIITIVLILGITTACEKSQNEIIAKKVHEHCTRTGVMKGNAQASLNYEIYYTGDVLNRLESSEKVTSTSTEILDTYEEAYRKIHANYEGIKYYETKVIRLENSVESTIIINYDKVDVDALIELEGEENSIFENKIPKVTKWKELTKKVGMECEAAE